MARGLMKARFAGQGDVPTAASRSLPAALSSLSLTLAMSLASVSSASARELPAIVPIAESDADVHALCLAWSLAEQALALANDLNSVASNRMDQAGKRMEDCKGRPECARTKERERLEQELRDAGNQQAKAHELAGAMEERKKSIRDQIERLYGQGAQKKCEST